jgi:hypothetical protein
LFARLPADEFDQEIAGAPYRTMQKLIHELDVCEYALNPSGVCLALPDALFEIYAGPVPRTFDDLDLAVSADNAPTAAQHSQ